MARPQQWHERSFPGAARDGVSGTPRAMPTDSVEPTEGRLVPDSEDERDVFEQLRAHLRVAHRIELDGHKPQLLRSQLSARMAERHIHNPDVYLELIGSSLVESAALVESLLIGSTRFFRDPEVFASLPALVLSRVVNPNTTAPLRLWVPGCSTGEEAYSLAIVVTEYLAAHGDTRPVRIIATDLREGALAHARSGIYGASAMQAVSQQRRDNFFVEEETGFRVRKTLRDKVVFGNHDLLHSPAYAHIDVVSCRNLLIYLALEAQRAVLLRLHYALQTHGVLVLGAAESVIHSEDLFGTLGDTQRFYNKKHVRIRRRADQAPARAGS